jgi:L-2-hydroxyglutarate oxidase
MPEQSVDVAIIGGGIVGLAVAYQTTQRFPGRRVVVLEKEAELASHQTGRNSGVLHSVIYYKPGSLKATTCRAGKRAMEEFCEREGVPFERCGKVIVAVSEAELPAMQGIYERGQANGVQCTLIDKHRLAELEPHAAGVAAIHVPETGIVDYPGVCQRLAQRIRERDGQVVTGARAKALRRQGEGWVVEHTAGTVEARWVINCAGLHSDRVTAWSGQKPTVKIIPFRGEYYELRPSAHALCRNLIYPVPDPSFPFLGVHFTRMIAGGVECGPNAVLAFAREGYTMSTISPRDLAGMLLYSGFRRLVWRYWSTGMGEMWRSLSKGAFVRALQRLVPAIQAEDLSPVPAGVRAQAVTPEGGLFDDFLVQAGEGIINVGNAPSPAATASLAIGQAIVDRLPE